MIILACDTGLATFGWALCELRLVRADVVVRAMALGAIETKPSPKKRSVLSVEDTAARLRLIADDVRSVISPAKVLCLEGLSIPRNAGSAAKMGAAWGLVLGMAYDRGLGVLQVSPQQVKRAATGKTTATKDEMHAAVLRYHPEVGALLAGIPKGRLEHPIDAVAVALACCGDSSIRIALAVE